MHINLVRAERSDRWQPQVVAELAAVDESVRVHVLPNAGHWVHVVRELSKTLGCYG